MDTTPLLAIVGLLCAGCGSSGSTHSAPAPTAVDLAHLERLRVTFSNEDWAGAREAAFERIHTRNRRGPLVITPPGQRFTSWTVAGAITTAQLDALLANLGDELLRLAREADTSIESRYPVTQVPEAVVASLLLSSRKPLAECRGFGFAVTAGTASANMELIATPVGDDWRLDCYFRQPVE